jgi:hypothetical protein
MKLEITNYVRGNTKTVELTDIKVTDGKLMAIAGKTAAGAIQWLEGRIGADHATVSVWNGPKCRITQYVLSEPLAVA